jgi:hydroxymethylpyrimidine pyrophosphatase-like HAD family hydrolase
LSGEDDGSFRFLVGSNGAVLQDQLSGDVEIQGSFPASTLRALASIATDRGYGMCLYTPEGWVAAGAREMYRLEADRSMVEPLEVLGAAGLDEFIESGLAFKVLLVGQPPLIAATLEVVRAMPAVSCFVSYPEYLEVMPKGITKAGYFDRMLSELGISASAVLTIGDGDNDVELMLRSGCAVCVRNASDGARSAAHYEAPSNDRDGVAVAIEGLVLGRAEAMNGMRRLSRV